MVCDARYKAKWMETDIDLLYYMWMHTTASVRHQSIKSTT